MKITMDGKYQTRDGRRIRLFSLNGPDFLFPIVGAIEDCYKVSVWRMDGRITNEGESQADLVPAPEEYQMWVVVGRRRDGSIYTRCSLRLRDVWTLDEGDVLLARKMVEIQEGYFDDEEHTP